MEFTINEFDNILPDNESIDTSLDSIYAPPPSDSFYSYQYMPLDLTSTAIACTWTYPTTKTIHSQTTKLLMEQPFEVQTTIMLDDIMQKWLKKCNTFIRKSELAKIEIYFEQTKQGLVHAHGLMYYNDVGLYNSIYLLMASAWAKISKGSVKAMSKNVNGRVNHAFDKCNNVDKWKEYIRKEQILSKAWFDSFDADLNEQHKIKKENKKKKVKKQMEIFNELVDVYHDNKNIIVKFD